MSCHSPAPPPPHQLIRDKPSISRPSTAARSTAKAPLLAHRSKTRSCARDKGKESTSIFLEPEGREHPELYVQGSHGLRGRLQLELAAYPARG